LKVAAFRRCQTKFCALLPNAGGQQNEMKRHPMMTNGKLEIFAGARWTTF
jgi:hypothetical protein